MVFGRAGAFLKGTDDVVRGGNVRVTYSQANNVFALAARFFNQPLDAGE